MNQLPVSIALIHEPCSTDEIGCDSDEIGTDFDEIG